MVPIGTIDAKPHALLHFFGQLCLLVCCLAGLRLCCYLLDCDCVVVAWYTDNCQLVFWYSDALLAAFVDFVLLDFGC
jgi:hypothetical protein